MRHLLKELDIQSIMQDIHLANEGFGHSVRCVA